MLIDFHIQKIPDKIRFSFFDHPSPELLMKIHKITDSFGLLHSSTGRTLRPVNNDINDEVDIEDDNKCTEYNYFPFGLNSVNNVRHLKKL